MVIFLKMFPPNFMRKMLNLNYEDMVDAQLQVLGQECSLRCISKLPIWISFHKTAMITVKSEVNVFT